VYAIEGFPLSCASLGGTLVGIVGLCVVVVFPLSISLLPAHQVFSQVSYLVSYLACIICISYIFIVYHLV
jgi:hypothetical protein